MKLASQILVFILLVLILFCGCEKSTGPKKDTTPPAAITDLRIVTNTETPITLTWTAPGDDGNKGTASWYAIRYSTDSTVLAGWDFAFRVPDEPPPKPAGTKEEYVVSGLSLDSNYFFGIRSQDDAGNWSPLSNIASGSPVAAGGIAFVSNRGGNSEIYVMGATGSYLKNITQNGAGDWDPAWSCDRRIAFVSDRGGGNSDIWISSADGRDQHRLTFKSSWHCQRPMFSPDGSRIVFQAVYGLFQDSCDIYMIFSEGTYLTNLTERSGRWDSQPVWSPDGRRIAFVSRRGLNHEIYVMNWDGSSQVRLTYNDNWDISPMWSPDGTKILFLSGFYSQYRRYDVWVMNPDGTDQKKLTTDGSSVYAVWSPDGMRITYESSDGEIYVMNSDGSNKRRLTRSCGYDGQQTWSPDGTKIAFVSNRDGNEEIYVMNADGTDQQNVSNHPARDFHPVWAETPVPR